MKRITLSMLFALALACGGTGSTNGGAGGESLIKAGTLPTDAQLCALVSNGSYTATGQQALDTIGGSDAIVAHDDQGYAITIAYDYTEHEPGQPYSVQITTLLVFDDYTHVLKCVGRGGLGSSAHPLPSCLPNTAC